MVCFPPARALLGTPACGTPAPASPLFVDTWSSGRTPPRTVSTVGYSTVPPRRRATHNQTSLFRPCFLSLVTCGLGSCPTVTTPPSLRVPTCSSRDTWRLFLPAGFPFTCGPRKTPRCPPSFLAGLGRPPPPLQRDGTPTTTRCPFLSLPTSARFSCSVPSLRSCLPTVSFPYWLCVSPPGATRTYFFYGGSVTCLVHSTGAQTSWTTCLFLLDPVRLLPVRARVTVRSPLRAQRSTTVPPP